VQKTVDAEWESEVEQIYGSYSIYHQSEGAEQSVFDEISGGVSSRSGHLLEQLRSQINLPETGRLLDVGCGNGAFLRAFSSVMRGWSLCGTELNAKYKKVVEDIPGVVALYVGGPTDVPGCFSIITLIHVLEHIPEPGQLLSQLWDKLDLGGHLVVEVPSFKRNPFDLLIADHITQFSKETFLRTVRGAGYDVITATEDWVPKELTIVARKGDRSASPGDSVTSSEVHPLLMRLDWLRAVVTMANRHSKSSRFGLFGTSIAATWLFDELAGRVEFFVDEDPNRAGRTYMDRPVYLPNDVPAGSRVLVALPPDFAEPVKARLEKHSLIFKLILPPVFAE
jgi:2-polyprenyl-3-methyl-5-hydroxy-6-metoxy-1,4-benzoquinol methylase